MLSSELLFSEMKVVAQLGQLGYETCEKILVEIGRQQQKSSGKVERSHWMDALGHHNLINIFFGSQDVLMSLRPDEI